VCNKNVDQAEWVGEGSANADYAIRVACRGCRSAGDGSEGRCIAQAQESYELIEKTSPSVTFANAGLVASQRGGTAGYGLARPA